MNNKRYSDIRLCIYADRKRCNIYKKLFILTIIIFEIVFLGIANAKSVSYDKQYKPVIMIDLDGVLDEYSTYDKNKIPKMKDGAKKFVKELSSEYKLVLFTTRPQKLALMWLIDNNIDKYFSDITNVKLPAYIYLDDRAIKFNSNYEKTLEEIKNFEVYWK